MVELTPVAMLGYSLAAIFLTLSCANGFFKDLLNEEGYRRDAGIKSVRGAVFWLISGPYSGLLQVLTTVCLVVIPIFQINKKIPLVQFNDGMALFSLGIVIIITGARTITSVNHITRILAKLSREANKSDKPSKN